MQGSPDLSSSMVNREVIVKQRDWSIYPVLAVKIFVFAKGVYTEGACEFQPRVCFETLGTRRASDLIVSVKGLRCRVAPRTVATPSELRLKKDVSYSQGFKANPGLEFANTFGVIDLSVVTTAVHITQS